MTPLENYTLARYTFERAEPERRPGIEVTGWTQSVGGGNRRTHWILRFCYPSAVKLLGRVVLAIFVLATAFIAFAYMRASGARDVDRAYHAAIPKTVILRSISFSGGSDIPPAYACKGEGVSPELSWEGAPGKAQSYVLIATDWDGPTPRLRLGNFTHWILYNIPQDVHEIKSAVTPAELTQRKIEIGNNSSEAAAYAPPCPPLGKHRYLFRVYALDVPQIHPASHDRDAVMDAMTGHVLAYGEIEGFFGG